MDEVSSKTNSRDGCSLRVLPRFQRKFPCCSPFLATKNARLSMACRSSASAGGSACGGANLAAAAAAAAAGEHVRGRGMGWDCGLCADTQL